jgi:16S rRNA (cytosine967-C5)-methyltransferase
MINARTLAYQVLLHLAQKASHPDRLIHSMLDRHSLMEERDRALMTELVYGVKRWQGRLDWHIDQLSKVKPKRIDPAVRILLQLALYQLLFLDRIPPHAAVNETVKMAKATQPSHVVGFVNAVLREAIRREGVWEWPEIGEDPVGFLAVTTSHPAWFVRRLLQESGFEEAQEICRANNTVAPMVLRVNSLTAVPQQVLERLVDQGIDAEPSPYLHDAVRITGVRRDVGRLDIFEMGSIQVQDEASQLISHLVAPRPGELILDLCAGFGGKSTHLGALMENRGEITAVDQSAWKLEELRENAARQGVKVIKTLAVDALELTPDRIGLFDRVVLDAPCSGFGTLRRNPDIKWRRRPKDPYHFSQLQKALLDHAALFVKPGGVLVYATCTVFREENEEVAEHFAETHRQWEVEQAVNFLPENCGSLTEGPYFRTWPHRHGIDGFFGARWRRE